MSLFERSTAKLAILSSVAVAGILSGCDALSTSTEPEQLEAPRVQFSDPNSAGAPATSSSGNLSSSGAGFAVQSNAATAPGFPEATIDPNGTVGRYQVGPSYALGGQQIVPTENLNYAEQGVAGWYGDGFDGALTANGERLSAQLRTFAHRTLPFGTIARITNLENGRIAIARVNDRGPIETTRLIDVTTRLAQELGFNSAGRANVRVEVLEAQTRQVAQLTGGTIGQGSGALGASTGTGFGAAPTVDPLAPLSASASGLSTAPSISSNFVAPTLTPLTATAATPTLAQPLALPNSPASTAGAIPAGGGVFIQAGSYSDQANAVRIQGLLQNIGPVQVTPANVNGRTFWRVRVGPYGSESEARIVLGRVIAAGATDAELRGA